jgi:preprotein translocase subunit SecA
MGLFSWLFSWRPKVREFADTYLMSRSQLNQNLVGWLPDRRRAALTLLLCHHRDTFLQVQDACNQASLDYRIHDGNIDRVFIQQAMALSVPANEPIIGSSSSLAASSTVSANATIARCPVILGLVQQLEIAAPTAADSQPRRRESVAVEPQPMTRPQREAVGEKGPSASQKLAVLVAERHQRRSADNRVMQFLRGLDNPSELAFFLAFDDPLLGPNIDTTVLQLLEHYGMKPNEPLQSQLLERLVRRLQLRHEREQPESPS